MQLLSTRADFTGRAGPCISEAIQHCGPALTGQNLGCHMACCGLQVWTFSMVRPCEQPIVCLKPRMELLGFAQRCPEGHRDRECTQSTPKRSQEGALGDHDGLISGQSINEHDTLVVTRLCFENNQIAIFHVWRDGCLPGEVLIFSNWGPLQASVLTLSLGFAPPQLAPPDREVADMCEKHGERT